MFKTWPWAKFERWEVSCKCGCGLDTLDAELMVVLLDLKKHFRGASVYVNSGCRCLEYNEKIQRSKNKDYIAYSSNSMHMYGRAVDITVEGHSPAEVYGYLVSQHQGKFGIGRYKMFVHLDTRSGPPWRRN